MTFIAGILTISYLSAFCALGPARYGTERVALASGDDKPTLGAIILNHLRCPLNISWNSSSPVINLVRQKTISGGMLIVSLQCWLECETLARSFSWLDAFKVAANLATVRQRYLSTCCRLIMLTVLCLCAQTIIGFPTCLVMVVKLATSM